MVVGKNMGINIIETSPNSALPALQLEKCNLIFWVLTPSPLNEYKNPYLSGGCRIFSEFVMCQCG